MVLNTFLVISAVNVVHGKYEMNYAGWDLDGFPCLVKNIDNPCVIHFSSQEQASEWWEKYKKTILNRYYVQKNTIGITLVQTYASTFTESYLER